MRSTLITRSLIRGVGIGATLTVSLLALSPGLAFAQSGTWNVDAAGNWSLGSNWDPAAVPGNAAGDVVGLTNNITAARTVTIDTTSRTVGALNITLQAVRSRFPATESRSSPGTWVPA